MTEEKLDKIISLATEGYDAAANCFSNIVTETIQEHGDIRTMAKFSAPVLVRVLVSQIHSLGKLQKTEELTKLSQALNETVGTTFPLPKEFSAGQRPGPVLSTLITLATQYQMMIIRVTQLKQGIGDLRALNRSLSDLQFEYSSVMEWEQQYPILAPLRQKNNIADIGVLITALIRESKEEITEIRKRDDTTRIMPVRVR